MKRIFALLVAVLLLCSFTVTAFAEGEAAAETAGPVMLPGWTPALAVVAGMAIAVSIFGWWTNRNNNDRRL